jgi:hypothetical protein
MPAISFEESEEARRLQDKGRRLGVAVDAAGRLLSPYGVMPDPPAGAIGYEEYQAKADDSWRQAAYAAGKRLLEAQAATPATVQARQDAELRAQHERFMLGQLVQMHKGAELVPIRGHLDYLDIDKRAAELQA